VPTKQFCSLIGVPRQHPALATDVQGAPDVQATGTDVIGLLLARPGLAAIHRLASRRVITHKGLGGNQR
jgi:hypothetical protein